MRDLRGELCQLTCCFMLYRVPLASLFLYLLFSCFACYCYYRISVCISRIFLCDLAYNKHITSTDWADTNTHPLQAQPPPPCVVQLCKYFGKGSLMRLAQGLMFMTVYVRERRRDKREKKGEGYGMYVCVLCVCVPALSVCTLTRLSGHI